MINIHAERHRRDLAERVRSLAKGRIFRRTSVFVWMFHRISGVLLIFLLSIQLLTGVFQSSLSNSERVKAIAQLHNHAVVIDLLAFLIIFHAVYGLRTIFMDLGARRERLLFWLATTVGLLLFAGFLVLFAMVGA